MAEDGKSSQIAPDLRREAAHTLGIFVFAGMAMFGAPLLVGVSYHLFGWQVAVLALPALYFLTFRAVPTPEVKKPQTNRVSRWITRTIIVGIPVFSVFMGVPDYMRIWAVAIAIGMFAGMGTNRKLALNMTDNWIDGPDWRRRVVHAVLSLFGSVLFVILSELVWRYFSLGWWIWFHAFAFLLIITLWMTPIAVASKLVSGEVFGKGKESVTVKGRRPSIRSNPDIDRYPATHTQSDGTIIDYREISPEQAKWLLARIDWKSPDASENSLSGENGEDQFAIKFGTFERLWIACDAHSSVRIGWQFSLPRRKWKYMGEMRGSIAEKVPVENINEVVDFAWEQKWDEIDMLLSDYIEDGATSKN